MTDELEGSLPCSQNSGMKMHPSGWTMQGQCVEEILINFTRDSMFHYVKSNGPWDAAHANSTSLSCWRAGFPLTVPLGVMGEPSLVPSSRSRIRLGNWCLLPFSIAMVMVQRVKGLHSPDLEGESPSVRGKLTPVI